MGKSAAGKTSAAGPKTSAAGTSAAGTSAAGTSAADPKKSAAGKADKQKVKYDAKTLTSATLLSKGSAAAAKYINTFGKIKPGYEDDMF